MSRIIERVPPWCACPSLNLVPTFRLQDWMVLFLDLPDLNICRCLEFSCSPAAQTAPAAARCRILPGKLLQSDPATAQTRPAISIGPQKRSDWALTSWLALPPAELGRGVATPGRLGLEASLGLEDALLQLFQFAVLDQHLLLPLRLRLALWIWGSW